MTDTRTSTRLKLYWLLHRLTSSYWLCFQCWMKHIIEHRDIQHGDVRQCREGKHGYSQMTDPAHLKIPPNNNSVFLSILFTIILFFVIMELELQRF